MDGSSPGYPQPTTEQLRTASRQRREAFEAWLKAGKLARTFDRYYNPPLNLRKREERIRKAILPRMSA